MLDTEDAKCDELSSKLKKSMADPSSWNGSMLSSGSTEPEAMAF